MLEENHILELINKAKNGNSIAFEQLLTLYDKMIHKINQFYGKTLDGYQEGVLGLYEAIEKYDVSKKTKFSTYLYLVVKYRIRSYISRYRDNYSEEVETSYEESNIENKLLYEKLVNWEGLTTRQKKFIKLHYEQGYKLSEIAKKWHTTEQNIGLLKQNILTKLRKIL